MTDPAAGDGTDEPVTPERIRTAVTTRQEFVRETPDGASGARGGRSYEAAILGNDLVVRQAHPAVLPHEARRGLLQLLNDWNRDRILPTLRLSEHTEGVGVVASLTVSAAAGMSREQLAEVIELGVVLGGAALAAVAGAIPPPADPTG